MSTDNIYSAPSADFTQMQEGEGRAAEFYVVAQYKFILLFVFTLGFYKIYWFYKNWSLYKASTLDEMWPAPRGLFSIFFIHSLFRKIDAMAVREGRGYVWNHTALATCYVIVQIIINVIDRLPKTAYENYEIAVELLLMLGGIGFILYSGQCAINVACGDPKGESNNKLTWANWLWLVIGGICLVMVLIGALMPDE